MRLGSEEVALALATRHAFCNNYIKMASLMTQVSNYL